jgi:hypothetical protein
VPSDDSGSGGEPTKHWVCNDAPKPLHERPSQERPLNAAKEVLWKGVQQHDRWRSEKDQWGRHCHQNEMLGHVRRKQLMIQSGNWGSSRRPG